MTLQRDQDLRDALKPRTRPARVLPYIQEHIQCIPTGYGTKLLSYILSTNVFRKKIQAWVVPPTAFSRESVYTVVCCAVTPYIYVPIFSINAISTASVQKRL